MSAACSIRMPRPFYWPLATASAPGLTPGQGGALVRTLRTEGLIEGAGRGIWTITQAGQTFSSATAAKPVTRATAERALSRFLERVTQVNQNPCFLAKATSVVLFGSMLKPEVEQLSDLDLAVELTRKEPDIKRAQEQNQQRAEELANMGRSFRNVLEWEFCWYWEAFRQPEAAKSCDRSGRLQRCASQRFGSAARASAHSERTAMRRRMTDKRLWYRKMARCPG